MTNTMEQSRSLLWKWIDDVAAIIGRSPPSGHASSPPSKVQSRPIPMSRLPPTAALLGRSGTMHVSLAKYIATKYDCILLTLPPRPIHSACVYTSSMLLLFVSKQYAPRILPHADVTQSDTSIAADGVLIGRAQALFALTSRYNWHVVSISTGTKEYGGFDLLSSQ